MQSGDEQLLYNQLERFKETPKVMNDYYTLKKYKLSEAHYRNEYNRGKYRDESLGYEETNKELDRAEQIQANTNNFHKMLKNKSKVDVVGERNGK